MKSINYYMGWSAPVRHSDGLALEATPSSSRGNDDLRRKNGMKLTLIAIVTALAALSLNAYAEEMNMGGESMQSMSRQTAMEVSEVSAEGIVKATDTEKHLVTIAHGPIPAMSWPAMTMSFNATTKQLASLKAGDKVAFGFRTDGKTASIVSIKTLK
jgi:Cu(I)/Ag(I) efflux system protein CusF